MPGWLDNIEVTIDDSELVRAIERVLTGELTLPTVSAVHCRTTEGRIFDSEIPIYLDTLEGVLRL